MERIRKGSHLPKKKWGSPIIQQKYSHTKLTQRSPALYFQTKKKTVLRKVCSIRKVNNIIARKGVETSIRFEAAASSSVDKKQLKTVRVI